MRISDWSSDVCSSDLPPAVLNDVAALARTRPLPRGLRIFDQGELAGRAHALLSGGVRITQSGSDGEEILVRFIGPSEIRSEEHTSELQSLMRLSYAVFCLTKKKKTTQRNRPTVTT